MRNSRRLQLVSLLFTATCTLIACTDSKATTVNADGKKSADQPAKVAIASRTASPLRTDLNKAKAEGKAVFVVVTGAGATDVAKANTIAKGATGIYKNAIVMEMNKDLAANADLVSEWGLTGAPVPLILSISPKGFPTGGFALENATVENVAALVPSPKLDEVYAGMYSKKPIFLVIFKKSFIDKAGLLKNCEAAAKELKTGATIVEVDIEDPKEASFIQMLKLQSTSTATTIMVFNATGQTTGLFNGKAEAAELVTAATKVVAGCATGCAPGGC